MIEPFQDDPAIEFRFARLNVSQLRAELERYRLRWRRGQVSWRAWKIAERLLTGEINFRESDPIK
jgi:hypothetical protein